MPSPTTLYPRATDIGVQVTIDTRTPDLPGGYDLTGATCVLAIRTPDKKTITQVNLTVDPGARTASFFTTATTFKVGGTYTIQMLATFGGGNTRRGAETDFPVLPVII